MPSTPTIKASSNIAIAWGSANAVSGANANVMPSGMLLETLQITPKNGDPTDIEDGNGFTAIQVGITDGFNAKATGVYDANKIMPAEGANITLVVPKSDGTNAGTTNVNCTFWSWGFARGRKSEKKVELSFTYRPLINT
jgi:hypothetical protein